MNPTAADAIPALDCAEMNLRNNALDQDLNKLGSPIIDLLSQLRLQPLLHQLRVQALPALHDDAHQSAHRALLARLEFLKGFRIARDHRINRGVDWAGVADLF